MTTILVIDDVSNIRNLITRYLEGEGYQTLTAANGREGLEIVRREAPDLIILDIMMPEMGGFEFMRAFSQKNRTPVIMLTARISESDKVLGLELGADDYVTKPFSMKELTARVQAVLRRFQKANQTEGLLRVGDIVLDRNARMVTVADEIKYLTPSELTLLEIFLSEPGRVFTRMDLLERLQGNAYEGYERTIDVHIRNLRAKVEPDSRHPRYIETVYGAGYRLKAPETSPAASARST